MKLFVGSLSALAVVALAINVGSRIPPDTVAMIIGVMMGALVTIPISLVIGAVLARRSQVRQASSFDAVPPMSMPGSMSIPMATHPPYPRLDGYSSMHDYPPVVIINPAAFQNGGAQAVRPAYAQNVPLLNGSGGNGERQFRIIGEDAT